VGEEIDEFMAASCSDDDPHADMGKPKKRKTTPNNNPLLICAIHLLLINTTGNAIVLKLIWCLLIIA
jgi:hypothetical protein